MPSKPLRLSDKASLPFKTANKLKRQSLHIKQKRARDALQREKQFARKKEEAKNPSLREERLRRNIPVTLDSKRIYDEIDGEPDDAGLGLSYDVERLKRRKLEKEQDLQPEVAADGTQNVNGVIDDAEDADSMLDEESSVEENGRFSDDDSIEGPDDPLPSMSQLNESYSKPKERNPSPTRSTTSTNLSLAPAALVAKFPSLFPTPDEPQPTPKILITTSINSSLHHEADILTSLFPNSKYIRRSSHRYGYKFSVREISSFASNQGYTSVVVLEDNLKRPSGLTIVHLPSGPTFHFSITNWYEGRSLPGHGRPTSHIPELILNNFTTPLGLLTAHLFRSLFPASPDLIGRQVVTLHNQRDHIFLRKHRYVLRAKRETEKSVVGADGKVMKATEGVRAGLQELGPRLTLKLRRIDKGIQRVSGQDWTWTGKTDRLRSKFQL